MQVKEEFRRSAKFRLGVVYWPVRDQELSVAAEGFTSQRSSARRELNVLSSPLEH